MVMQSFTEKGQFTTYALGRLGLEQIDKSYLEISDTLLQHS